MDIAETYHAGIDQVLAYSGMPDKLVHVHVGLTIYVLAQIVLRTRRASLYALAAVFLAEAGNEIMDRLYAGSWRLPDTLSDFAATLFWPLVLVLASQYRRRRWISSDVGQEVRARIAQLPHLSDARVATLRHASAASQQK